MPRRSKRQKLSVAIVGAGTLASALARALHARGCSISEIISRNHRQSLRRARKLATEVDGQATTVEKAELTAGIIWICVPDDAIAEVAVQLAERRDWHGKIALHSSGALSSDSLSALKARGAEIASAHPLMSFVKSVQPELAGVSFAIEGDRKAMLAVTRAIRDLGGRPFQIGKQRKPAYHAFGFFSSPAIVALIAAACDVGKLAGLDAKRARGLMEPIVRQTIENCFRTSPAQAFSGPVRRGDVETVRKHLQVLGRRPDLLDVYRSLVRVALKDLPSAKTGRIEECVNSGN